MIYYSLECSGCDYCAAFTDETQAQSEALRHALLGAPHAVTCTRPAHDHDGSIPVIAFTARADIARSAHARPVGAATRAEDSAKL